MNKKYKIQLPKGKKVTMTSVDFEDGVMTVNVELENDFHKSMHDEVCGVFGKINNQLKEALKANGVTREKIEEMAKDSIKELEKDCPDIWDKMMQEYGEAICGKTEKKYEPKDGDFVFFNYGTEPTIAIYKGIHWGSAIITYASCCNMLLTTYEKTIVYLANDIRPATEREKKILIDKLAKVNKKWNPKTKRIEDVRWRANDGYHYYYLLFVDTDFIVTETTDIRMDKDDERYNSGNYFKTSEAAEKASEQIREIFKNSKVE